LTERIGLRRQYGGRIIYPQLGPEPLDAYPGLLEEVHGAERFQINEASLIGTALRK